jgi:putative ABC transport system permease protein
METIDISLPGMLAIYALFLIPLAIIALFKLGLVRESLLALARMTVQLLFVGVYLEFIFELNSWAVNLAWVAIMLLTANCAILSRAHLSKREMFPATILSIAFATAAVAGFFAVGVLGASPRNARYLIPILGMILGNCMRGNVIALERFFSGIRENEMEFITYQLLGATPLEAARPYLRRALKAAVSPYISTMATIGIVSLPGMLTGQILGGSLPLTAIKYQIAIMVCIFSSVVLAAALNLLASTRIAFDQWGMLRGEVFAK